MPALRLLPRPLRLPQFLHSKIRYSVNPHNPQRHHSRRDDTADNEDPVGIRIVLGQPTDQRGVDSDQDTEDQLEPADFFLESVDLRYCTVKMSYYIFTIYREG